MNQAPLTPRHPSALALCEPATRGPATQWPEPAHVETCAQCRAYVEADREARATFRRDVFARTLPALERRFRRRRLATWIGIAALAPALGAMLFLLLPARAPTPQDLLARGQAGVQLLVAEKELPNDAPLARGTRLQFQVEPGGLTHVLVASVDTKGHVHVWVPADGTDSIAIDGTRLFLSPPSSPLDSEVGPERGFVFLSQEPIALSLVKKSMSDMALSCLPEVRAATLRRNTALNLKAVVQLPFLWENVSTDDHPSPP